MDDIHTILIVDDNADCRLMLRTILEMRNFRIVEAADGNQALDLAREIRPDLILMDVRMPDLDGFETARRLRVIDELRSAVITKEMCRGD